MFGSAAIPAPSSFAGQQAVQGVDLSKEPTAASPTATGWSRGNKPVKSSEGGRCRMIWGLFSPSSLSSLSHLKLMLNTWSMGINRAPRTAKDVELCVQKSLSKLERPRKAAERLIGVAALGRLQGFFGGLWPGGVDLIMCNIRFLNNRKLQDTGF